MSNFRLNARKPQRNNAGLGTPKGEIFLLYREDIVSMPDIDKRGVLTSGDIMIKAGRRFHILYTTPTSQVHYRETEGDVDSRGWKKKITGHYPGDELEINEFVKNNLNQGFIAIIKSCDSEFMRIYGSVNNPLYFTGSFTDDNDKKGYELTFEQNFADENPVLFYQGKIIVDEDALSPTNPEFSSLFVKLDASNITEENREALRERLGIGDVLPNVATIDLGEETGNAYTKEQIGQIMRTKVDIPSNGPTPDVLGLERRRFLVGYEEDPNTIPGQVEPFYNPVRFSLDSIGKNLGNSNLKIPQGQIRELDVTGAKLRIKGLEKKSMDPSHNLKIKMNANGDLSVSDEADISINIPEEFSSSESLSSTTINVNHIFPTDIPERPSFADEIKNIMKNYKNYDFQPIISGWKIVTKNNSATEINRVDQDGYVYCQGIADWNQNKGEVVVKIQNELLLPNDKDWLIVMEVENSENHRVRNSTFGVGRSGVGYVEYGGAASGFDYDGYYQHWDIINTSPPKLVANNKKNATVVIIKTSGVITTLLYSGSECIWQSSNANVELGDYVPCLNLTATEKTETIKFKAKFKYKIL
ncbi:hypothetical protein [Bergeyella zoohelcum]|nr:hypothetical protein [Bergeyella zoohelcum]